MISLWLSALRIILNVPSLQREHLITKKETEERVTRKTVISLIKSKTIPIEKISEIMSLPLDEVKRIAQDIEESDIS